MSKNSGAEQVAKPLQWTRAGTVRGSWGTHETFESLVFAPALREHLQKLALGFLTAQDVCQRAKLPWRRGAFVFGPAGCGKTAASRAIALQLGWQHFTVPAHEILDAHSLTRALFEIPQIAPAVVALENIDEVFKRVDAREFFDVFDLVAERAEGIFWVATTRHAEDVPKNQLLRPGRFEERLWLSPPGTETKKLYYETHIETLIKAGLGDGGAEAVAAAKADHLSLLEANKDLTFAQLQEMRLLIAKVIMDGVPDKLLPEFRSFCQEQVIGADRSGGRTSRAEQLEERVKMADPRLLISGLQICDVFKRIVEMTVTTTSEALTAGSAETKS